VEYALLAELVLHPHVPLSRERLAAASHPQQRGVSARAIDTAIVRLRRLLEPEPGRPRHIRTVRGQGYMFVAHPRSADGTAEPDPWRPWVGGDPAWRGSA
jgi:two-component system phosphate regulon response regulator OmpR